MKTKTRFLLTLLLAIAMGTKVMAAEKEAYAVYTLTDSTLTFYYDDRKSEKEGIKYSLNTGRNEPEWIEDGKKLARAVFTLSFADYRPTSTFKWFYEQPDLKTIDHISDYLKTDEVTIMEAMLYCCESLNNLDVSGWDTSNVTNMAQVFNGCISLTSLDVSSWDTSNVNSLNFMFFDCSSLTSLDLSDWDTSNVKDMYGVFNGCSSLTTLDMSSWDTSNVTDMAHMFVDCSSLTSLNASSWDTGNVTRMDDMFLRCSSLTTLDLSGWDTGNVVTMYTMFNGCTSLTTLDLSGWDTSKVLAMENMFFRCEALTTIYVGPKWAVEGVKKHKGMFSRCENLCGSAGTTYDPDHTDGSYAHVDGGPSNPGYLSERIYNLWVGGTRVTPANSLSLPATAGTVTYDPAKKTLTLNNATITVTGQSTHAISNGDPWEHSVDGIDGLTIEVIGNCRLNAQSVGLVVNGNTTLTGTGQLSVNAGEEGVWIEGKNLTSKVNRLAVTAAREAVKGTGFGILTVDASTFEALTSTPDMYHPIKNLFRMNLTDSRYADPGGAWKYADITKYYYDEDRGFMIFGDEDYRGKVLIEPAAAPVNYRLWVGGARVTSANKDAIGVASGTATFNPETQTLRLTDATIAAGGYDDGISNGLEDLQGMPAFKIVCNGTNSIDAVNSDGAGLALFGNTTITGSRLGISAYDKGIYVGDFGELNLQDADVHVEGSHPIYCGYNTYVYVRHSRLEADPGTSQNSPVVGAREFDLVDSEYQDPGIGIDPDQLYYNERAEMMYYDGYIYDGPILIAPVGSGTTTGVDQASLRRGNGEKADGGGDYYTLDGRKLSGKPGKSGVYIRSGRKVVVR
jgi:surface protein